MILPPSNGSGAERAAQLRPAQPDAGAGGVHSNDSLAGESKMLVVIALLRGITPSGKECKEDEPEPAQLHADEIRDENEHAGAENVLHLNLWKARTMRTFRGRERPGKGYGQGEDEESEP